MSTEHHLGDIKPKHEEIDDRTVENHAIVEHNVRLLLRALPSPLVATFAVWNNPDDPDDGTVISYMMGKPGPSDMRGLVGALTQYLMMLGDGHIEIFEDGQKIEYRAPEHIVDEEAAHDYMRQREVDHG